MQLIELKNKTRNNLEKLREAHFNKINAILIDRYDKWIRARMKHTTTILKHKEREDDN